MLRDLKNPSHAFPPTQPNLIRRLYADSNGGLKVFKFSDSVEQNLTRPTQQELFETCLFECHFLNTLPLLSHCRVLYHINLFLSIFFYNSFHFSIFSHPVTLSNYKSLSLNPLSSLSISLLPCSLSL